MLLKDKVILITGAGTGIGRGTSKVLHREGATLILADINQTYLNETQQLIQDDRNSVFTVVADISTEEGVASIMDFIVNQFGRLDGAFNNAGISGPSHAIVDYPNSDFDKVVAVDLKSVWMCLKAQIALMLQQDTKGAIVNTASAGGIVGKPGISAYVAAKHGVVGLTKTAALEYGKFGIRINAVCPGVIQTEMLDNLIASGNMGTLADWNALQPIGRMGTTEEIGEFVAWALSDRATLLHGQSIALDGGLTIA